MNGDGVLELYAQSYEYAKEHGELKMFFSSNEENIKCKWDIKASAEFYVDTDRVDVFLQDIASKYGAERALYVLSRTVQKYGENDSRFSVEARLIADKFKYHDKNKPSWSSFTNEYVIDDVKPDVICTLVCKLNEMQKGLENTAVNNIPDNIDKFYNIADNEQVVWIQYNPDGGTNGQFIYIYMNYDDILNAVDHDDPLEYLFETCNKEFKDKGTEGFDDIVEVFLTDSEDISSKEDYFVDKLLALTEPRYAIYQLKDDESLRDYRFANFDYLQQRGLYIDRENYNRVYRGRLQEGETLEDVFCRFNMAHPKDFNGRSLSISDIVTVVKDGTLTAHYVDRIGFKEIADFALPFGERKARRAIVDNLPVIVASQLASDELDELAEKLFNYDNAPKRNNEKGYWQMGNCLSAGDFEDITARYNKGEDICAELAQKIVGNPSEMSIYDFNSRGGYENIRLFINRTDDGLMFRTEEGFEVAHSWKTLGNALVKAAKEEYEYHLELDKAEEDEMEM